MYFQYSFLGGFAKLCFHQLVIASLWAIVVSRGAAKSEVPTGDRSILGVPAYLVRSTSQVAAP